MNLIKDKIPVLGLDIVERRSSCLSPRHFILFNSAHGPDLADLGQLVQESEPGHFLVKLEHHEDYGNEKTQYFTLKINERDPSKIIGILCSYGNYWKHLAGESNFSRILSILNIVLRLCLLSLKPIQVALYSDGLTSTHLC